jgi:hypothetical protein
MNYCNSGNKPTVKYKFAEKAEKIYKCDIAPIEIITKTVPIRSSENYDPGGYNITVWQVDGAKFLTSLVRDHEIFQNPANGEFVFTGRACEDADFRHLYDFEGGSAADFPGEGYRQYRQGFTTDPSKGITIDRSVTCPVPLEQKCSIQVFYNNAVIFQDQGDCPLEFEVICENCPSGYIECKTLKYPGYCCLPCSITNEIANIITIIKNINNG